MPCQGPLHLYHIVYDVCPLSDPDVDPSVLVCDVKHTSFHSGLAAASLFSACLTSARFCNIWHSWQHSGVVHLSLRADGKVAFEVHHHTSYFYILICHVL